jgi:multicomponent Na+:H+ antiporter subunit F
MIYGAVVAALLAVMGLSLVRALKGPSVYDRLLAANTFGTLTVVMLAVYGFMRGRPEFLDIALVYAVINFIGTIAVAKFVKFSHLGHPAGEDHGGDL